MPITGGWSPSPERTGGGDAGTGTTLLQRVFESLAAQRGDAYDQTINSAVGVENLAYARALVYDGYFANQRLANNCLPSRATLAAGTLQRWELILATPPLPSDSEIVRRARVVAAWARIGEPNSIQPMIDALQAVLGPLYIGIVHQNLGNALTYVNGVSYPIGTPTTAPTFAVSGTPTGVYYIAINITVTGGYGVGTFQWYLDGVLQATDLITGSSIALGGTGLALKFQSTVYTNGNSYVIYTDLGVPWASTIAHVDVQVTQNVTGYANADGSPNAAFYNAVAAINPILDELLPSWATFDWFIASSHGGIGFYMDEPNVDLLAFDV